MDFLFSTSIEISGDLLNLSVSKFGESDFFLRQQGSSSYMPESVWIWVEDNQWNASEALDPRLSEKIFSLMEVAFPLLRCN